uniref:Uncharacterized protein n=1 Tax=Rhodopseudomonas palustris (strain DX-1) TaxID=652103 RepID=E6VCI7_RHOPX
MGAVATKGRSTSTGESERSCRTRFHLATARLKAVSAAYYR